MSELVGLIEFDGFTIKYPNGFVISINLDEDDFSYTYDVYDSNGNCVYESMCLISQAHNVAVKGETK